jgi:hypothetical protein
MICGAEQVYRTRLPDELLVDPAAEVVPAVPPNTHVVNTTGLD